MKVFKILVLVGRDRPGIVDKVSAFLFQRGANIEDSRMAAMGGRFSVMVLFSCSPEQFTAIQSELRRLDQLGFETSLHEADDPAVLTPKPHLPLKIEVTAMDHPGIVQKVVHVLHQHQVNIISLNTHVTHAPLSGGPLFNLILEAGVPADASVAQVKRDLEALAVEMNLGLNIKT
ncbi:MAG: ACT domain-containing protein [Pseudomonadota bacterium]